MTQNKTKPSDSSSATTEKNGLSKTEKLKLFKAYEDSQKIYSDAVKAAEDLKLGVSVAVRSIYELMGCGPFMFKNLKHTAIKRQRKDLPDLYYFRVPESESIEEIK